MLAPAQAHDQFFCSILELVPRDLLLNRLEAVADGPTRFQKHKKRSKQSGEHKKAEARKLKRRRFDLALSETVSEAQARREEEERQASDARLQELSSGVDKPADAAAEAAVAQEELKQFLENEADVPKQRVSSIVELQRRLAERIRQQQQHRAGKGKKKLRRKEGDSAGRQSKKAKVVEEGVDKSKEVKKKEVAEKLSAVTDDKTVPEIDFGDIIVPDKDSKSKRNAKPKGSKIGELRMQLAKAEAKERRLAEMQTTDDGALAAEQQKWADAMHDTKGDRVKDNPKLLRKALKARERKKGKSRDAWQGRLKVQEKAQKDKQDTRRENLNKRKSGNKSADPKAKRTKGRAGFEGRKSEFLNKKQDRK